jgi:hypothetical protein
MPQWNPLTPEKTLEGAINIWYLDTTIPLLQWPWPPRLFNPSHKLTALSTETGMRPTSPLTHHSSTTTVLLISTISLSVNPIHTPPILSTKTLTRLFNSSLYLRLHLTVPLTHDSPSATLSKNQALPPGSDSSGKNPSFQDVTADARIFC